MVEAEFDTVVATYVDQHARSIRLSGEGTDFFAKYKITDVRKIVDKRHLSVNTILDFGAGIGSSLRPMRERFPNAHITCLDVSKRSLELCQGLSLPNVDFRLYDGQNLPLDLGSFDLIFTACVFHHIDARNHIALLRQIRKLLSPQGIFVLFEHNPWNPLTRHAVSICPFDQNAVLINAPMMKRRFKAAGFEDVKTSYRIFFPGFLASFRRFEAAMSWLPVGAQYSIVAA